MNIWKFIDKNIIKFKTPFYRILWKKKFRIIIWIFGNLLIKILLNLKLLFIGFYEKKNLE
jgi:hypothetical protein